MSMVVRSSCAAAHALDSPLWKVPNKAPRLSVGTEMIPPGDKHDRDNHLAGIASDHLSSSRPTARSLSQGMKTDKRCSGGRRRQGSFTFARSPYPRARIPYASSNRRSLGFWTHSSQSPPKSSLSFRLTCPFAPRSPSARDSCVCVCMCVQTQLAVFKL
jgi:hypothetical protein